MKILFVLEYYYPNVGGVEKLFKQLAEEFVKRGNTVRIITSRISKKLPNYELINGVEVIRISFINRFLFTFLSVFKIYSLSKHFDLIHTTSYNAAFPAFVVSKLRRKKCIITFHEIWGKLWFKLPYINPLESFLFWSYEKFILALPFDFWVAVSNFTLSKLKNKNNAIRIYNGINYPPLKKQNVLKYDFVYFGRLGVSKGLDILMEAAILLKTYHSEFKILLIVPEIDNRIMRELKNQIKKHTLLKNIFFKHNLSENEIAEYLLSSNCTIVPSYSEGFCFAAVEAISLGIPVISSGNGALSEVISGKYIVFDPFCSESLLKSMLDAKKQNWKNTPIKKFNLNETVEQYLELYTKL